MTLKMLSVVADTQNLLQGHRSFSMDQIFIPINSHGVLN